MVSGHISYGCKWRKYFHEYKKMLRDLTWCSLPDIQLMEGLLFVEIVNSEVYNKSIRKP